MAAQIPPAFALGPALANGGVIHYLSSEGIKIYQAATSALVDDSLFDFESLGLSHSKGNISIRAEADAWNNSIFTVPVDLAQPMGDDYAFIAQYGLSLIHI